jgi:hypothetical protein
MVYINNRIFFVNKRNEVLTYVTTFEVTKHLSSLGGRGAEIKRITVLRPAQENSSQTPLQNNQSSQAVVTHTCNPSFSEGREIRRIAVQSPGK